MTPQERLKEIESLFRFIKDEEDGEAVWWLIARVKQLEGALESLSNHVCLGLVITPDAVKYSGVAIKARKALESDE